MTDTEYKELKDMTTERLLPLRNHKLGIYVTANEIVWGDGKNCGKECGFTPRADIGGLYFQQIDIKQWDDYKEQKERLEKMLSIAEERSKKVTKMPEKIIGIYDNVKADCDCSGDGNNPYANSLRY